MRTVKMSLIGLAAASGMLALTASVQAQRVKEEWVARYNGPGNAADGASALAIDDSGNVYVTGSSRGGEGRETYDYATIKYDPTGKKEWVARYNGPDNQQDYAMDIAIDTSGNVYVTGYSHGGGSHFDYATIKYDAEGAAVWAVRYNGPGNDFDYALALAVDPAGNIYVTGSSDGGKTRQDYATIKYDTEGNQLWIARWTGPGRKHDSARDIAVDAKGNVYVTGCAERSKTDFKKEMDYVTVKYDPDGNELWARRYKGPGKGDDCAGNIAVDALGNVYVTGGSEGKHRGRTYYDYATIKYDTDGNELWVARYNGPPDYSDIANGIAVDDAGNVYVTGRSLGKDITYDYATIKYDAEGNKLWVARYSGPAQGWDVAYDIAVDGMGNVYVTGESRGGAKDDPYDYATVKYDPEGKQLWVMRYSGPAERDDRARVLALDRSGNVYVTGTSFAHNGYGDYATIKYSQGPECTQDEKLKARCKDKKEANLAIAKATRGTPGDTVEFCLDNDRCKVKTINHRGKARKRWKNVTPGEEHSVTADWDCGAQKERTIDCPNP